MSKKKTKLVTQKESGNVLDLIDSMLASNRDLRLLLQEKNPDLKDIKLLNAVVAVDMLVLNEMFTGENPGKAMKRFPTGPSIIKRVKKSLKVARAKGLEIIA
jgi:hypothetical protein